MSTNGETRSMGGLGWTVLALVAVVIGIAILILGASRPDDVPVADASPTTLAVSVPPGHRKSVVLGEMRAGETYRLLVTVEGTVFEPSERSAPSSPARPTTTSARSSMGAIPISICPIVPIATAGRV